MQIDALADELMTVAYRDDLDPSDKRVRCDTIRWLLSKLSPRKYGDRLLVAGDTENPLQLQHKQVDLSALSGDQLDAIESFCHRMIVAQQGELRG
jgi:hypothetical protein